MADDTSYIFAIMFVTLGPLKTIPVFHMLTHHADFKYRINLAFRAFVVAAALVLFIAFVAIEILQQWRVSLEALIIAGGVILFVTALRTITTFDLIELPQMVEDGPDEGQGRPNPRWMSKPTLSPLVIPGIITPIGVVTILFFVARAQEDLASHLAVLLLLGLIMLLNLGGMLVAGPVMRIVGLPLLQVIGWVLSVLQAGLAVQAILRALIQLHIIA